MGLIRTRPQIPRHVQPALRRIVETFQGLAVDGVDGDPLARSLDADDTVAGQRMAAVCIMHRHAGNEPLDRDRERTRRAAAVAFGRVRRHAHGNLLQAFPLAAATLAAGAPENRAHDVGTGMEPLAHRGVEVVHAVGLEPLHDVLEHGLRRLVALVAEGLVQDRLAHAQVFGALFAAHETADARTCLAGDDEVLPRRRRRAGTGGDDLHLIAVFEGRPERHDATIDTGADA